MNGIVVYVPLDEATKPVEGHAYVEQWWTYHPERGVAVYYNPAYLKAYGSGYDLSPQCNRDEYVSRVVTRRLYPDHEIRCIPVVFKTHLVRAMKKDAAAREDRAQRLWKRRVKNLAAETAHQERTRP